MQNSRSMVFLFLLLFAATVGGWFIAQKYMSRLNEAPDFVQHTDNITAQGDFQAAGPQDNITVKIYYPSDGASPAAPAANSQNSVAEGLSSEDIRIAYDVLPVKLAEQIIPEYLKRLPGGLKDTRLLGLYRDRDNVLYVDLSDEFRRDLSGDAQREYYVLKSLYKTLTGNLPGITDVKVLIEGREIESPGGHFVTLYPLGSFLSDQAPKPPVRESRP